MDLPAVVSLSQTRCLSLRQSVFLGPAHSADHSAQSLRLDKPILPQYPWIGQITETDCGLASLAMVYQFYHQQLCLKSPREHPRLSSAGLWLFELRKIARETGFVACAVRVDVNHLAG